MVTIFTLLLHHSYPSDQNPTTDLPDSTHPTTTTTNDYDIESENTTANLDAEIAKENSDPSEEIESESPPSSFLGNTTNSEAADFKVEQKEIDEAVNYGLKAAKELFELKEPLLYDMGEWCLW